MSKEKQIEEMAKVTMKHCKIDNQCRSCHWPTCNECLSEVLYNAGFRKQSKGEWIKTETNYTCSKCNFDVISWSGEYDGYERQRGISLMKFCPNCGAKMKGGEEA